MIVMGWVTVWRTPPRRKSPTPLETSSECVTARSLLLFSFLSISRSLRRVFNLYFAVKVVLACNVVGVEIAWVQM
jgi:hypothetical protein